NPRLGEISDVPDATRDVLNGHRAGQWWSPQLPDFKAVRQIHTMWNIGSFHTLDTRHSRSLSGNPLQPLKCFLNPFSDHFNGAVGEVADDPPQAEPVGLAPHEPA